MKRWAWIVLALSIALNVGLLSAGVMHWQDMKRAGASAETGAAFTNGTDARTGRNGFRGRWGPGRDRAGDGKMAGMLHDWPDRRIESLGRRLDLSPEQRARLHEELSPLEPRLRESAGELLRERMKLRHAFMAGPVDTLLVRDASKRVAMLQARLDSLVAEAMVRETSVLTPEQRDRYQKFQWGPNGDAGPGR